MFLNDGTSKGPSSDGKKFSNIGGEDLNFPLLQKSFFQILFQKKNPPTWLVGV